MGIEEGLEGRTILLTRARGQGADLQKRLEFLGARAIHIPTIEFTAPQDWQAVDDGIARLVEYDWLLLTSANAVDEFFDRAGTIPDIRIAVVGPQTARRVRERGREPDLIPKNFRAAGLLDAFPNDLSRIRILFPRAEVADETLPERLRSRGATVDVVVVYRTVLPKKGRIELRGLLQASAIDCITLTSGSTVVNLLAMLDTPAPLKLLDHPSIAVIGPVTRKAALDSGLRVDVEAEAATIPALVEAIQRYFSNK